MYLSPWAIPSDGNRRSRLISNARSMIKHDMEKMAELTEELKGYLARSAQGVMSVDAIKKAAQIE